MKTPPARRLLAQGLPVLLSLAAPPTFGATLSPAHHTRLAEAHALIDQEQWEQAEQALTDLRGKIGDRAYPRALVLQAEGWLYTGSGELTKAVKSLRDALALEVLPRQAAQDTRYLLAQLLLRQEEATAAAAVMDDWLAASKSPSAEALYLAGTAHALAGNNEPAGRYLERAVAGTDVLPEAWGQRLLAVQLESGQAEEARALLRRLIAANPDQATYWLQLADVEANLAGPGAAVAVLDLARNRGLLRQPTELLDLAGRWLRLGVPERAATLLQDTLDEGLLTATPAHLDLAAEAWWQSGEPGRARAALDRAIALEPVSPSKQGTQEPGAEEDRRTNGLRRRMRLARMAAELEDWNGVLTATKAVLAAPGSQTSGTGHLLAGIARYHRGEIDLALQHFELAASFEDTRADAEQWLSALLPAKGGA